MNRGLGLAQQLEGPHRAIFHGCAKRGGANDLQNRRQRPMLGMGVLVRVLMRMRVFMRSVFMRVFTV
jgi:hypothetical protein